MEGRHILREMSMLMLCLATVFSIFLCANTCSGALSEVSKHDGDREVLEMGLRRLLHEDSQKSSGTVAPASSPYVNKTSASAPSPSTKGYGTGAKAKPLAGAITGQSWCVAMSNVPDQALQAALDYACGMGGADCGPIQQGGICFQPDSLASHASFAFNSYYQKNGMAGGTCDFGGAAMITPSNPSYATCQYPLSGGLSLTNTTGSGTPGVPLGFVPPYSPSMDGAYSVIINLELLLSLTSLLVAALMFSDQF